MCEVTKKPFAASAFTLTYSARLVALRPVTVMDLPVSALRAMSFESVDQRITLSDARCGRTVAVRVTPGPPVRMEELPGGSVLAKGSPTAPAGRTAPGTAAASVMRKTSLLSFSYFERTPAG